MMVVFGWVLTHAQQEKVTSANDVIDFVKRSFNLDVNPSWVSRTLSAAGFSSQRTKSSKQSNPIMTKLPEMKQFILSVRELISDGIELSRVVAMDDVMFWNSGSVLRSYAV